MRAVVVLGGLGLLLGGAFAYRAQRDPAPPTATVVAVPSLLLFSEVLADFRRVTSNDLPARSRDLATVRAALPFPVNALTSPELRLLAVWTTDLGGESAAVLAYRWQDRLVLQYVVSEQLLFRPSDARRAFADGKQLAARSGQQSVIAWPGTASGELLVGDMSIDQLARLRETITGR
jgi:xanthosine utilization system XapX-like protein